MVPFRYSIFLVLALRASDLLFGHTCKSIGLVVLLLVVVSVAPKLLRVLRIRLRFDRATRRIDSSQAVYCTINVTVMLCESEPEDAVTVTL